MRWIALFCLLSSSVFAGERVNVTVNTQGKSSDEVRFEARSIARLKGVERLPMIIAGKETLNNDVLHTSIKALSLSAVKVSIMQERWNDELQSYELVADVAIDEARTRNLLNEIKDNTELQTKLNKAYEKIESLSKSTELRDIQAMRYEALALQQDIDERFLFSDGMTNELESELRDYYDQVILRNVIRATRFNIEYNPRRDKQKAIITIKHDKQLNSALRAWQAFEKDRLVKRAQIDFQQFCLTFDGLIVHRDVVAELDSYYRFHGVLLKPLEEAEIHLKFPLLEEGLSRELFRQYLKMVACPETR